MKINLTLFIFFLRTTVFASINKGGEKIFYQIKSDFASQAKPDTSTINRLNKLSAGYFMVNTDSSAYYSQKSIFPSQKISYKRSLAYGLLQSGSVDYYRGDFAAAKQNFEKAIIIFSQLNDKKGLGHGFMLYGKMYNVQGDYKKSLDYLSKAVELNGQIKNELDVADDYKNIGTVYFGAGKLPIALDFYYKALYIDTKLHNNQAEAAVYNDIGIVLNSMGVYSKALQYFNKALNTYILGNNLHGVGVVNENIGEASMFQNKNDQAIAYLEKAGKILERCKDKFETEAVNIDIGMCYANKSQFTLAINFLDTALQMAKKYKTSYNQTTALIAFATVYNQKKDYRSAYFYAIAGQKSATKLGNISLRTKAALQLKKTLVGLKSYAAAFKILSQYNDLRDTLNEDIQNLTLYNLEQDFTAKKKVLELQQSEKDKIYKQRIQQQRFVIAFSCILILAMIGVSLVYFRQNREQQKINSELEEMNQKISQKNSDFYEQAKKLDESNTLKDRLIAILAHDLRAPLTTLRGLFGLLQDATISHEEMLEMTPAVFKKLEYTSDFLDTLLFWINSQMENFANSAKNFDIKDVVAVEMEMYREPAVLKRIKMIDNIPSGTIAYADPNSIRIVVRNLMTNAIKFSRENDTIEITAGAYDENNQLVTVSDTGIGMNSEQLNKLFKTRVDSKAGTGNETGTGMAMLFCKDLVEKNNGKIWVTSTPGEGTKFWFTVPAGVMNEKPLF